MSDLSLQEIPQICHSSGGVKVIQITDLDNISLDTGIPTIVDTGKAYKIYFKYASGGYKEKSQISDAGKVILQTLSMFINKKRFAVDYIIGQLLDNQCHVIYEDWNGDTEVLLYADLLHEYESGQKLSDPNGYKFEFSSKTRKKYHNLSGIGFSAPQGEAQNPGAETGQTGSGQTGGNTTPGYFVEINPTQLVTTPAASGNTTNLNKFVTGADGRNYFIDHLGNAMHFDQFPNNRETFEFADFTGNTFTVTETLPTDDKDFFVVVNGSLIQKTDATVTPLTYSRSGQDITIYKATSKTKVEVYWN